MKHAEATPERRYLRSSQYDYGRIVNEEGAMMVGQQGEVGCD